MVLLPELAEKDRRCLGPSAFWQVKSWWWLFRQGPDPCKHGNTVDRTPGLWTGTKCTEYLRCVPAPLSAATPLLPLCCHFILHNNSARLLVRHNFRDDERSFPQGHSTGWHPHRLGTNVLSIPACNHEIFATLGELLQNLWTLGWLYDMS